MQAYLIPAIVMSFYHCTQFTHKEALQICYITYIDNN
jgi:hypothetical protein